MQILCEGNNINYQAVCMKDVLRNWTYALFFCWQYK